MKRDKDVTAMFEARGWKVLRIWECELKNQITNFFSINCVHLICYKGKIAPLIQKVVS
mgnify:CR=1 FL=1